MTALGSFLESTGGPLPESAEGDLLSAYYRRLTSPDRNVQIAAARAWSVWEGSTLSLLQDPERVRLFGADTYAIAFARIECHYFIHRGFLQRDDQLLRDAVRLRGIPTTIGQGRYDVVCPMRSAWDLHRALPKSGLRIIAAAGHSALEPGISRELVAATDHYA